MSNIIHSIRSPWFNQKLLRLSYWFLALPANEPLTIYKNGEHWVFYDPSKTSAVSSSIKYPEYQIDIDINKEYGTSYDFARTFKLNSWKPFETPFVPYDYSAHEYGVMAIFVCVCLFFSFLLGIVVLFVSSQSTHTVGDKGSIYECGFEPFGEAHSIEFSVQYFVVGILYLIFDLELAYLFPWALCLGTFGPSHLLVMWAFILLLILGFIYEWRKGALEWD